MTKKEKEQARQNEKIRRRNHAREDIAEVIRDGDYWTIKTKSGLTFTVKARK